MSEEPERLNYLQSDGSPHFLTKVGGVWVSDRWAVTLQDVLGYRANTKRLEELEKLLPGAGITDDMVRRAALGMRRFYIMSTPEEPMPSFDQLARAALEAALKS